MSQGFVLKKHKTAVIRTAYPMCILTPWQVEWGAHAGAERTKRNAGRVKDKPDYDGSHGKLQPNIQANTASCLCELAASLYVNQRWNGPYWHPQHQSKADDFPDVGYGVEVRRTRTIGGTLPVFPREARSDLILVQAYISQEDLDEVLMWSQKGSEYFEYVKIDFLGAVYGDVAYARGDDTQYSEKKTCKPEWFFSAEELLNHQSSFEELRALYGRMPEENVPEENV